MIGDPEGDGQKPNEEDSPKPAPVIIRIFRALKRYEYRQRRRRNSQHQINERMMARWTRQVGLFTGALVVVGILTAGIFYLQLGVMRAEQRAWLAPGGLTTTEKFRTQMADMEVDLEYSNTGKEPAIKVNIVPFRGTMTLAEYRNADATETVVRKLTGDKRCSAMNVNPHGPALFPNQKWKIGIGYSPDDIAMIKSRSRKMLSRRNQL